MLTIGTIKRTFNTIVEDESSPLVDFELATAFLTHLEDYYYTDYDCLDDELLKELSLLYAERWGRIIKGQQLCYTKAVDGCNEPWLSLAYLLLDNGYLVEAPDNQHMLFIKFIMPTVTNYRCDVSLEYFSALPLNECILSEDETTLIPLDPIFSLFEKNKVFSYISKGPAKPLSPVEISRIEFAYRLDEHGDKEYCYWQEYQQKVRPFLDNGERPILLSTVLKVKELVEETCIEKGFYSDYVELEGDHYLIVDDEENDQTQLAYLSFLKFLKELPSNEREALFSQKITHNYQSVTFGEMWCHAFDEVTCTSYNALYFMKLVKDYLPHTAYIDPKLTKLQDNLGASELKKVKIPDFELDEETCNERCSLLMSFLLTNPFRLSFGTGSVISLEDSTTNPPTVLHSNTVPKTGVLIFNVLKDAFFIHQNWQLALYDILQTIVTPELNKDVPYGRYPETQKWLQELASGDFFSRERSSSFVEISQLVKQLCDARELSNAGRDTQKNYITQLIMLSSTLKRKPNCVESNRKLMKLCTDVKLFLENQSHEEFRLSNGDKVLQTIKRVAVENLLTQLACKQVSTQSFFGKRESSLVDQMTLLQLKTKIKQELELNGFLTIEQTLLAVLNKIRSYEHSSQRYNLSQAESWLSDLGFNNPANTVLLEEKQPVFLASIA